jgi:hypothetical protein
MSGMNDQHFFDLAMKVIARQATDVERAELDSAVAGDSNLKAELERLRAESRVFKEVLPLVEATGAKGAELPDYARARLQAKVSQTFRNTRVPERDERKTFFAGWRLWALGLAAATALLAILLVPLFTKPPALMVQVAMLDLAGATRGSDNPELNTLKEAWKESSVESFSSTKALDEWEKKWPDDGRKPVAKIVYDRSAGELRVTGRFDGTRFEKTFPVEPDLATAIKRAASFIKDNSKR